MLRWNLVLLGAPAGLCAGLLAWLFASGGTASAEGVSSLSQQVARLRAPPHRESMRAAPDAGELTASPVFALTVGPGAVKEPTLQLQGISITRQRTAALISIDGRPAEWLALGESRDGVTLESVQSSRVVIDTVLGAKDIALGEQVGPPPADAGAAPMVAAVTPDAPPPGVRSPPPPANAPRSP